MNLKAFFVTALSQALELSIATPDDVLKHVTPELLASHLPRPLWARLLTACLGAPQVDAQLVVDAIGMANLCEYIPGPVIWGCLSEIGRRSIGVSVERTIEPSLESKSVPLSIGAPPPTYPRPPTPTQPPIIGPTIPAPAQSLAEVVAALEADEPPPRGRTSTQPRLRPNSTSGIGRFASNARRPQASATPTVDPVRAAPGRLSTEADYDVETEVKEDWKQPAVEDELHDWPPEETVTQAARDIDLVRKR